MTDRPAAGPRRPDGGLPARRSGGGSDPRLAALVVTPDAALAATVTGALLATDWRVDTVAGFAEAVRNLQAAPRQAVLIDQSIADGSLDQLTFYARRLNGPDCVVVAYLHEADRGLALSLVRAGVRFFAAKPADPVFLTRRLAEFLPLARRLEPFPAPADPLARPLVVVATRSLELPRQLSRALEDECPIAHYDGLRFGAGGDSAAAVLVVDEGMPNGLDTVDLLRAVYGAAPAVAVTGRGAAEVPGFAGTLVKPVREAAARRLIRQLLGRTWFASTHHPGGVVLRLREQWAEAARGELRGELRSLAVAAKRSGRRWLCLEAGPLTDPAILAALRTLLGALSGRGLHVGVATVGGDPARTAFELGIPKEMVHPAAALFIRRAQSLP